MARKGNYRPGIATALRCSLELWDRIGSPYWTARTLDTLAQVHYHWDEIGDSRSARSRAAALRTRIGLT